MATTPTVSAFMPAPSGYVVDFDNPQRKDLPMSYWVSGALYVLATASLVMRIYTRTVLVKDFKWEDWFIVLAYVCMVLSTEQASH
jgi:hypothetical protein